MKPRAEQSPTLFQTALRERWHHLPASLRRLHSVQDQESFHGRATVTRGRGAIAGLAAWIFGFPPAADDVPLALTITCTDRGEIWQRSFGGWRLSSTLSASSRPYHYNERVWLLTCEQELPVRNGSLSLPARRGWLLGLPLPAFLLPKSQSREYDEGGVFHFDIGLYAPLNLGLIVRYQGYVEPDASQDSGSASAGRPGGAAAQDQFRREADAR